MSADWGPVIVSVVLFILLSPGLLFQLPARTRVIEFGNMCTSGIAILVHAVIYFCIITILMVAIGKWLASVDMEVNSHDQNSIDGKEKKSVDSNGLAISLHAPKLQLLAVPWK
ncbi:hypothetical protein Godav_018474 [Gossypium davidsonii]|uniref:Uncharacterized protein n=1 Tax=Gossypium davidsonii TaxID=34287 RepID=A0A7J8QWI9_GOSDV|nr:hypothetical protein [Gossypium davidsonii]